MNIIQKAGLGNQSKSDDAFTARMRLHQSWWRAAVLRAEAGFGPSASSKKTYGNILDPVAAEQGKNFLTSHIHDVVRERIAAGGGVEKYRCMHNMLSSQPMCFNLFGQLVGRGDLATRLIAAIIDGVDEVTDVRVEYAPSPKADFLDDATSFDAFVEYTSGRSKKFIAIETKLTESFSPKVYGLDYRPAYAALAGASDRLWLDEVTADELTASKTNQLWRNHMLAASLERSTAAGYASGLSLVVLHPEDARGRKAVDAYRAQLKDPDAVRLLDLRTIVDAWRPLVEGDDRAWIDAFDARYLQLDLSAAWVG